MPKILANRESHPKLPIVPAHLIRRAKMHTQKDKFNAIVDMPEVTCREDHWGGMTIHVDRFAAGFDPTPFFRGLPDDRCQCPHWGYVIRGRMRVLYPGREEVIGAGEVYYMEPGHLVE